MEDKNSKYFISVINSMYIQSTKLNYVNITFNSFLVRKTSKRLAKNEIKKQIKFKKNKTLDNLLLLGGITDSWRCFNK